MPNHGNFIPFNCFTMRPIFLIYFFFLSLVGYSQRKALIIIADGIPADVIEKTETPHLDDIAKSGGYGRAFTGGEKGFYTQSPTISAPGYAHTLTGVWSYKHNIWDNDLPAPNYTYPTIFRLLKMSNPQASTAIFSTWTDNRTKLVGEGLSQTGNFKFDYIADGFELDTIQFPVQDSLRISKIDDRVTEETSAIIREKGPDLSWVYLEFTDDMGHRFGDSPKFYHAVKHADEQIGKIWESVKYREKQFHEEWMVVITTDHGRTPDTGKGHGGQSDRERTTWIVTNVKNLNHHFKHNLAAVDITPSVASFLGLNVPENILNEWDGIPFVGNYSITNLKAKLIGNKIDLTWQGTNNDPAIIQFTTTHHFKSGGQDIYKPAGTTTAAAGSFTIDNVPASDFYKIVVKTRSNTLNVWVDNKR